MFERLKAAFLPDYADASTGVQLLVALKNKNVEMLLNLINEGVDLTFNPCPCSDQDCPSTSILQTLVRARDFATLEFFSNLHPNSPVNLAEHVDKLNHSVAWILVKNKQFSLLQEFAALSADAVINFSEKHNNVTLLDLLAEQQQWDVIKTLIYASMSREIVQSIKPSKSLFKNMPKNIKDDIESLIHVNNEMAISDNPNKASNKSKLKTIKNIENIETSSTDIHTKTNLEITKQNVSDEIKLQNISIPAVVQLFDNQVIASLTNGKQIFITLEGSDIEKMTALRKLFKSMSHSKVTGSNNVIEIEVKNQKILEDFLRSKYQVISNILNPKSTPDKPITFISEAEGTKATTDRIFTNNKPKKEEKSSAIAKKIQERQDERDATKKLQQDKRKSASKRQPAKNNNIAPTDLNNSSVENAQTETQQKSTSQTKLNPRSAAFIPSNPNIEEKKPQAHDVKVSEIVEHAESKTTDLKQSTSGEKMTASTAQFAPRFFKAAPEKDKCISYLPRINESNFNTVDTEEVDDDETAIYHLPTLVDDDDEVAIYHLPTVDLDLEDSEDKKAVDDDESAIYHLPKLW